ncbi:MAG TPA: pyridoxamine 5'-phosphate oxidase family protein [Candidatus Dormibacteraeota bacterium]|nr:pyridoxamine 5'-phosphate oxidase family protein [Candidatus Dormibacteraeota bacterium]
MRWDEFDAAAPELARLGLHGFEAKQLCMLGTLRRDGSPRISPCEMTFLEGELLLGMMWQSPKALDLLRDARCVLHSCTSDKAGSEGDFKLYGQAREITQSSMRDAYKAAVKARIDWEPPGPFHLFAIEVSSAGYVVFGDEGFWMTWDPSRGLRRGQQREA